MKCMFTVLTPFLLVLLCASALGIEAKASPKEYWELVMQNGNPMPRAIKERLPSPNRNYHQLPHDKHEFKDGHEELLDKDDHQQMNAKQDAMNDDDHGNILIHSKEVKYGDKEAGNIFFSAKEADDCAKDGHPKMYAKQDTIDGIPFFYDKHGAKDNHLWTYAKQTIKDAHESLLSKDSPRVYAKKDTRNDDHQELEKQNAMDAHELLHANDDDHHLAHAEHDHFHPSHITNMEPSWNVFFMQEDLKSGKKMPIYFPHQNLSLSPSFLPRRIAKTIPFSTTQLSNLLKRFSINSNSPQAQAMHQTLKQCEHKPSKGETRFCATSLESMLDFVGSLLGVETQIQVLTTTYSEKPKPNYKHHLLQNYTILEKPVKFNAFTMVACHSMPYPYAVFYCHQQQKGKSEVFEVKLEGENGGRVEAVAVCHLDPSDWDPDHVSFKVLNVKPGITPVCHFFPEDHLVWVSASPSM